MRPRALLRCLRQRGSAWARRGRPWRAWLPAWWWQPRRRRMALASVGLILAVGIGLLLYVRSLLQPQRFTAVLDRNLAVAGLQLELSAPAKPTLFPHPGVELRGLSLANAGAEVPLLRADSATIALPWRTLLRGDPAIGHLRIEAPRIDLAEVSALLARLPRQSGPPVLPSITTGVHIRRGILTDKGEPILFGLNIDTGALAPGQAFQLDASARSASRQALAASLAVVPSAPHDGRIDFAPIDLQLRAGDVEVSLQGQAQWRGGENLALKLAGTLRRPATVTANGVPAAAATGGGAAVDETLAIRVAPADRATPLTVGVKLEGTDARIDLRLQPTEVAAWWNRLLAAELQQATPWPITGTASIAHLDLGWLKASGLEIEAGPPATPAPATTTH